MKKKFKDQTVFNSLIIESFYTLVYILQILKKPEMIYTRSQSNVVFHYLRKLPVLCYSFPCLMEGKQKQLLDPVGRYSNLFEIVAQVSHFEDELHLIQKI